jgi:hypothetical protein
MLPKTLWLTLTTGLEELDVRRAELKSEQQSTPSVHLKPKARPFRAKPREYSAETSAAVQAELDVLAAHGLAHTQSSCYTGQSGHSHSVPGQPDKWRLVVDLARTNRSANSERGARSSVGMPGPKSI